ncbi:YxeA family protein [Erysipelothrix sp. HDW6A]|uniref:YxeA family protein n=1 Tax=Erysipelothrix sp. HDW6A TaxID=2714928 RepID=UPI001408B744|nr:YxeA family protein [Erysipelothrix sp. HDW6A]QIK57804.1 YxeA family protein [Erysipelothrix sp. HDW6A]
MKKKNMFISIVALVLFFTGLFFVKQYNDGRYAHDDYFYYKVPADQSTEIEDLFDDSGKIVDKGKEYKFIAISENGEEREVTFTIQTKDSEKLLQPGQYLKIAMSKELSLSEKIISESDVPKSVLAKLNSKEN